MKKPEMPRGSLRVDARILNETVASPACDSDYFDTKDSKVASRMLLGLLRNYRQTTVLEHDKELLDRASKRREQEQQIMGRFSDLPSLPELQNLPSRVERARVEQLANAIEKRENDLASMSQSFVSQVLAQARQSHATNELMHASTGRLQEENRKLRDDVARLSGLVDKLSTKVEALASTNTGLNTEVGRLTARAVAQTSTLENMQNKLSSYGDIDHRLASIEQVKVSDLHSIHQFVTTDIPRLQQVVDEQKTTISRLKTDLASVHCNAQTATVSATAPTAERAVAFPGDDFATLRFEIGALKERMASVEAANSTAASVEALKEKMESVEALEERMVSVEALKPVVDRLNTMQIKSSAASHAKDVSMQKMQDRIYVVFGNMIDEQTKARRADRQRLAQVEAVLNELRDAQSAQSAQLAAARDEAAAAVAPTARPAEDNAARAAPEHAPGPCPAAPAYEAPGAAAQPGYDPVRGIVGDYQPVPQSQATAPPEMVAQPPDYKPLLDAMMVELAALKTRVQAAEDGVQGVRLEADAQVTSLRLMVMTLDTQFSNLTTKDLFNAIVGHIEKMYPNGRQLQQDLQSIVKQIQAIEKHDRNADNAIRAIAEAVNVPPDSSLKRPLADVAAAGAMSNGGDAVGAKRRRTNGTAAGTEAGGTSHLAP